MTKLQLHAAILSTLLLLSPCMCALAQAASSATESFTQYRGNPDHTGNVDYTLPVNLALAWQNTQIQNPGGISAPVVADDTVFYGQGGHAFAVDVATGAVRWKFPKDDNGLQTAFNCPPAYANGYLYIGNDNGTFYCLNGKDGKSIWEYNGIGNAHVSPVVQDKTVYLGVGSQLVALDTATGRPVWTQPKQFSAALIASPAIGNGYIYAVDGAGRLYSLSLTSGRTEWMTEIGGSPVLSGALVFDRNLIYVRSGRILETVDARGGDVRSRWPMNAEIVATPSVADDGTRVVATSDLKLSMLDSRGRAIWSSLLDDYVTAPPLITHNSVIACTNSGVVYVLDRQSGAVKWQYAIKPIVKNNPNPPSTVAIFVSPVIANGSLYILSDDGTLSAFRANAPDNAFPVVTAFYPGQGASIPGGQIEYQIVLTDIGSGVRPDSISLTVDGVSIPTRYDVDTTTVRVKTNAPAGLVINPTPVHLDPLSSGPHKATITASDWRGNKLVKNWSFTVDPNAEPLASGTQPQPVDSPFLSQDSNNPSPPGGQTAPTTTSPPGFGTSATGTNPSPGAQTPAATPGGTGGGSPNAASNGANPLTTPAPGVGNTRTGGGSAGGSSSTGTQPGTGGSTPGAGGGNPAPGNAPPPPPPI